MSNVLCRHCFHFFPEREVRALCTSAPCSRVRDERDRVGPRFLVPRREPGLWSRLGRRPVLDAPCPYCRQVGTLQGACPSCRRPLHRVGDGGDHILAVLGARESGKSHYLATLFHQFLKARVGDPVWQVDIDPDSRREYEKSFLEPLFEEMQELPMTPREPGPEMRLLLEHRRDGRRVLLAFRDLSGEAMASPGELARVEFLRYASGVVLLADPLAFPPAKMGRRRALAHRHPDCVEVLRNYRRVLAAQPRFGAAGEDELPLVPEKKYLAVAVTKADLVLHRRHPFWSPAEDGHALAPGYWERRREESRAVEDWLAERLDGELAAAAEPFADVGYFFVSNFGYVHKPHTGALKKPPQPLRVHEPVLALLDRLAAGRRRERRGGPLEDVEELAEL